MATQITITELYTATPNRVGCNAIGATLRDGEHIAVKRGDKIITRCTITAIRNTPFSRHEQQVTNAYNCTLVLVGFAGSKLGDTLEAITPQHA